MHRFIYIYSCDFFSVCIGRGVEEEEEEEEEEEGCGSNRKKV